jgi:hypothetical protein
MKSIAPVALLALSSLAACASSGGPYARPLYVSAQSASSNAPHAYGASAREASAPASPAASTPTEVYGGAVVTGEVSASRQPEYDAPARDDAGPVDVAPEARPGLATEWGEARYSAMSYAPFVRGAATPVDVATIHYNDAGLAAMQAVQHGGRPARWVGVRHDGVRVSLRGEGGDALPGYYAGDTVYVLGSAGQHYTIVIENTTPARFETVVSVDGLDVINGRPASMGQRGYILQPYGRVEVEGFRQSRDTVASFRFGSVGDSYAAQRGDARNVGVIGVALFAERGAVVDLEQNEVELRERANPFPNGFAPPPPRRAYY